MKILDLKFELNIFFTSTDNPRYIDTQRDMSFVSSYRICQYIEMEFHSIILPPEINYNAKLSIYRGLTVYE